MDPAYAGTPKPVLTRARSNSRQLPTGDSSLRSYRTPMRDVGFKKVSPQKTTGKQEYEGTSRTKVSGRNSPTRGPRPLVPLGERVQDDKDSRVPIGSRRRAETSSTDIAPDGGSVSRRGRQFIVANVGRNGKISMRPTVRPANQRYPQPHFVFPITPPNTAGLDQSLPNDHDQHQQANTTNDQEVHDLSDLFNHSWNPTTLIESPQPWILREDSTTSQLGHGHRRAMSDSTAQDVSIAHESEDGGFKVVISKPRDNQKAKTTEDIEKDSQCLLQISIPSWRLGTARFTLRGTPLIRGSSYAPTEGTRASNASLMLPKPSNRGTTSLRIEVPENYGSPEMADGKPLFSASSPRFPGITQSAYLSTHTVIEATMFDNLTLKPECDDPTIVRYSSRNDITAATPPRLVAEVTSPSFVDYELLSDFFLAYRAFLDSTALLRLLIARLKWALSRTDEAGLVARVRTFVAIRHWILNYFVDDFVIDYQLRIAFCNLLNDLFDDLSSQNEGKVPLQIISELKKCWRRNCAQFWDSPDYDINVSADVPLAPGGIVGHRDPDLDPTFWEADGCQLPPIGQLELSDMEAGMHDGLLAHASEAVEHVDIDSPQPQYHQQKQQHHHHYHHHRSVTSEREALENLRKTAASPVSIASLDIVSCSFPTKSLRFTGQAASHSLAAHPANPSSIYHNSSNNAEPVAVTPRGLQGKRVRSQNPRRHDDIPEDTTLPESRPTTEKINYKNAELTFVIPFGGSLVRGNLLPPGQAYVDIVPSIRTGLSRQTTVFQSFNLNDAENNEKSCGSAMSSAGMKKLLRGVRRALRSCNQQVPRERGSCIEVPPLGPRGATTNRLPGTALVPQVLPPRSQGWKPSVRMDILAVEIAEDFKNAVQEDAEDEELLNEERPLCLDNPEISYSAAHLNSSFEIQRPRVDLSPSDADITAGSKSIVIMDATLSVDHPAMTGAIPVEDAPLGITTGHFTPPHGVDLTPPNTPPSHMSNHAEAKLSVAESRHSVKTESLLDHHPLSVPDLKALAHPLEDNSLPALRLSLDTLGRPSVAARQMASYRRHTRQQSSRSLRSKSSLGGRRWSSLQSVTASSTRRSLAGTSDRGEEPGASEIVPPPLRVLRRRPGGDLKGVQNVADLDTIPLRRSRSLGSLTSCSDSMRSSYLRSQPRDSSDYADVVSSELTRGRTEAVFSLGALAERAPKPETSFFSTHSSKPAMRPSFELEAQMLAQIPDDDDDGGVESALAKLEGKFEKKSPSCRGRDEDQAVDEATHQPNPLIPDRDFNVADASKRRHRRLHVDQDLMPVPPESRRASENQSHRSHLGVPASARAASILSDDSKLSYNSIPLLERDLTEDGQSHRSVSRGVGRHPEVAAATSLRSLSYKMINKTASMERTLDVGSAPHLSASGSFDRNASGVDGSALSSELSNAFEWDANRTNWANHAPPTPTGGLPVGGGNYSSQANSSSSPLTLAQALKISPEAAYVPRLHEHQIWNVPKPLPPTPETTPTSTAHIQDPDPDPESPRGSLRAKDILHNPHVSQLSQKFAVHLPFILAFDSEILAQQFTLIEKDALNEIDWKELIDMRWTKSPSDSRSWVEFLKHSEARGVEVVVARFNIMVKWVISEIVLTQDIEERARCIIKFLHTAAHCRRYRNFATMGQIAIALTSNDVARLARTWALVPPSDKATMAELETLVSPTKNFYNLRAAMEGAAFTAETPCIPFVCIYTHDLLFNSQRPSEIASSPNTPPLVNFERYRIAASIVKTLLRLLATSVLYDFQPIEGITERCLWVNALSDEEIRRHSENLEMAPM